jgi:Major Facilitator Superfamily
VALGDRIAQFRVLGRQALHDLFDQSIPFGRLALVQVLMLAGDTLVTISLAGSLFFSISPNEAKTKVFLYLVLTLAPFAIVSPLLGPAIDRSRGARRAMVMFSSIGRAIICPLMATHIHSLLLFPLAFLILVLSKLYLVTRGALVTEMVQIAEATIHPDVSGAAETPIPPVTERPPSPELPTVGHGELLGMPPQPEDRPAAAEGALEASTHPGSSRVLKMEFAALNARLTLLGTVAGFVVSLPGILILKLAGAPGVLVFATLIFIAGAFAGARLPVFGLGSRRGGRRPTDRKGREPDQATVAAGAGATDPNLAALQPVAHPEVLLGLTTMSLIRGLAGFLVFLLAFGLRREHAALWWYGFALAASGIGAILGLVGVARLRERLSEQQILLVAIWLIGLIAVAAAYWGTLPAQALLALAVGVAGSLAQPSFDAMTQRYVPPANQGRAFARFATRQQLVWCFGALIPVVVTMPFPAGDMVMAAVAGVGGLFYVSSRRALRGRALPHQHGRPEPRKRAAPS